MEAAPRLRANPAAEREREVHHHHELESEDTERCPERAVGHEPRDKERGRGDVHGLVENEGRAMECNRPEAEHREKAMEIGHDGGLESAAERPCLDDDPRKY